MTGTGDILSFVLFVILVAAFAWALRGRLEAKKLRGAVGACTITVDGVAFLFVPLLPRPGNSTTIRNSRDLGENSVAVEHDGDVERWT